MKTPAEMYKDAGAAYAKVAANGHFAINSDTAQAFILGFAKGGEYIAAIVQKEVGMTVSANHITSEFMDKMSEESK